MQLMCDEYGEKTQRLRALQKRIEEVKKTYGEYAMSGRHLSLYSYPFILYPYSFNLIPLPLSLYPLHFDEICTPLVRPLSFTLEILTLK